MSWASSFDREWFDDAGCSLLDHAEAEAHELGHYWFGSEHLLLGVLHTWPGLRDLGGVDNLEVDEVRAQIRRVETPADAEVEQLHVTPRARVVVGLAREEALRRGGSLIDPRCVWFGIAREGEGVAMRVLADLGVSELMIEAALDGVITTVGRRPAPIEPPPDLPRRVQAQLEGLLTHARAAASAADQAADPDQERSRARAYLDDALQTLARLDLISTDQYIAWTSRMQSVLYPSGQPDCGRRSVLTVSGAKPPQTPDELRTKIQDMLFFHVSLAQSRERLRDQGLLPGADRRPPLGPASRAGMFAMLSNLRLLSADEVAYWRERLTQAAHTP